MFVFRKTRTRSAPSRGRADTKLELTQREEAPSKLARRRAKRRPGARKTRLLSKTVEEGSKRATRKKTGQTVEDDAPSLQKTAQEGTTSSQKGFDDFSPRRVSKAAKRAQVKVFVEETFKKGVKGLIAEFKSMKRVNDFTKMTEFVAQNAQGRNRYKDVGCLDNDRVILHIGPVSYIHANYVSSPTNPKRFICTQAPLPKTCPDFWYMVVQEKSASILMLCNFVEQNAKKCAEYFPTEDDKPLSFEGVTVTCKKQEQLPFPFETRIHIRVRHLEVNVPGQPMHPCKHYHWQDWPDRGVPDADLAPIVLLSKLKDSSAPIIVHCSAGIGRTGSIVLIQHAMELLHIPAPLLEISTYLVELRKQRNNSIQTEHQYLYIHQVLLLYLKKTKYLDESVTPYMEAFTRDYINATKGF
uniref:Protein-tyrosine phosphatase n=1 Tax=Haemonchus contortus TaxID=6289 RepID=A0A7I4Y1E6_HAECO|nr:Protein-tyrosine phosphatase domain containing protein [Haemonchus contortus]